MLSWLYMVPVNIGESKKTHKCKYRREYRWEKFCCDQEEKILFLIYKKAYYQDLTIIMKDYTFDIPSISLSNKE